ncbi:hypothetical protein GCM10017562_27520 [Streptomyces roseofulvus]|uniref:Uncharacterized protein n=2 Tax=Streptomyces TaxID=1883 RepID=A0ABU4K2E6_9ACTN|nr:hypothetical protein [Streptomyces roseolus]MDX2291935.1 hypothetical protein [Streptomyces roseolus]
MKRSSVRLALAFTAALGLAGLGGAGTAAADTASTDTVTVTTQYFTGFGTGSTAWAAESSASNDAYAKASFAGYPRYTCYPSGIPYTRQISPYMYWSDATVRCTK